MDAVDVACTRIHSGAMKVLMENVEDPRNVLFLADGRRCTSLGYICVDPIALQYEFSFQLPASLRPGDHLLDCSADGNTLPPFRFAIESWVEPVK